MDRFHSLLPFLAVALLATIVAACGSDSSGSKSRDADTSGSKTETEIEPGTPEAGRARTGSATFAITPELTDCMSTAGFSKDPKPVAGGIVSWRSDAGAQVVIAGSSEVALSIAGEIGTTEFPASVDGTRVSAGPAPALSAAAACLAA